MVGDPELVRQLEALFKGHDQLDASSSEASEACETPDDADEGGPEDDAHKTLQESLFDGGLNFIDAMMLPEHEAEELKRKHTERHVEYLRMEARLGNESIQLDHFDMLALRKSPTRKACEHIAFATLVLAIGAASTVTTAVLTLRMLGF
jgi:hypothetical protein